ncbi:MAG: CBS domain-containing protein [Candidatus Zixiibacteriota bacterium]|nr:MAG: CBS domain-containing protein [candidate division Zixibacteria bacterium]
MLLKKVIEGKPKQVATVAPSTPIPEAIGLFVENTVCCLPVVDKEGKPIGILADMDVLETIQRAGAGFESLKVKDAMKPVPIVGNPDDEDVHIAERMEKDKIRHVPVVKEGKVIAVITLKDIYGTRIKNMATEIRYLTDMLYQRDKSGDYDTHY